MEKKYYKRLDFIKGLTMFLVIVGHCIQCGSGAVFNQKQAFFDDYLFRFIYSFHMPLFMIISGFLYAKTASGKPFMLILKTRTFRLLLPIFVWQTIMAFLSAVRGRFDAGNYITSIIEGFWFLWAAWWATITCAFVEAVGKTARVRAILHVAIILLTFITPDELNFSLYKFMYVSFLIGYMAAKKVGEERSRGNKRYVFLASTAVVFAALFIFYRRESFIYISGWTLLGKENWLSILGWDFYRTVLGGIGGVVFIYATHLFIPESKGKLLQDIGRNSSGIYILQTYANALMLKYLAGVSHHIWMNLVEAVVVCASCYIGVKIISLIPYAPQILFGQKSVKVKE